MDRESTEWLLRLIGTGVVIGILFAGGFFIGAYKACSNGGGELSGLSCVQVKELGVCFIDGKPYKAPAGWDSNVTFEVNIGGQHNDVR